MAQDRPNYFITYVERLWLPIVGALALVAAGMLYVAYKQGVFGSPPPGKKPKRASSAPRPRGGAKGRTGTRPAIEKPPGRTKPAK